MHTDSKYHFDQALKATYCLDKLQMSQLPTRITRRHGDKSSQHKHLILTLVQMATINNIICVSLYV